MYWRRLRTDAGANPTELFTTRVRAMYDAAPLTHNVYKVQQAASLLRTAMRELSRA